MSELQDSVHAKCMKVEHVDGRPVFCSKSKGHEKSADPKRRLHADAEYTHTWK